MNNSVFREAMENVRKHRDIKLMTTDEKRSKLVLEPNYHTKRTIFRKFVDNRNGITKVKMNKPVYLGMSILDISKTLMYKFWYGYIKLKYGDTAKLCYTDTDSFITLIITEDFYKDIADDVKI